jgi:hypothetical protein
MKLWLSVPDLYDPWYRVTEVTEDNNDMARVVVWLGSMSFN